MGHWRRRRRGAGSSGDAQKTVAKLHNERNYHISDYAVDSNREALRGELDKLREAGKVSPELYRAFRGEATPDTAASSGIGRQNLHQDDEGAAGQDEAGGAGKGTLKSLSHLPPSADDLTPRQKFVFYERCWIESSHFINSAFA